MNQIQVIKEDADVFLAFQKHREKFLILHRAGVFDLEAGKVELNIHNNQIQNIVIPTTIYKRIAVPPKGGIY